MLRATCPSWGVVETQADGWLCSLLLCCACAALWGGRSQGLVSAQGLELMASFFGAPKQLRKTLECSHLQPAEKAIKKKKKPGTSAALNPLKKTPVQTPRALPAGSRCSHPSGRCKCTWCLGYGNQWYHYCSSSLLLRADSDADSDYSYDSDDVDCCCPVHYEVCCSAGVLL